MTLDLLNAKDTEIPVESFPDVAVSDAIPSFPTSVIGVIQNYHGGTTASKQGPHLSNSFAYLLSQIFYVCDYLINNSGENEDGDSRPRQSWPMNTLQSIQAAMSSWTFAPSKATRKSVTRKTMNNDARVLGRESGLPVWRERTFVDAFADNHIHPKKFETTSHWGRFSGMLEGFNR